MRSEGRSRELDDPEEGWRAAVLCDGERHEAVLTLAATRALRAGRPNEAWALIDRRCRVAQPGASDLAIRALAARLCANAADAAADLSRAVEADPSDPFVAATAFRFATDDEQALVAATRVAAASGSAPETLRAALARLVAARGGHAELDCLDARLSGLVAWREGAPASLVVEGPDASAAVPLSNEPGLHAAAPGVSACLLSAPLSFAPSRVRLVVAGETVMEARLWPRVAAALGTRPGVPPACAPPRAPLLVVVPIHGDEASARQCLAALLAEGTREADLLVRVVDDASPEPELVRFVETLAAEGLLELVRTRANLGFAGAVRRGMEGAAAGRDVLFLNSDAVLPAGALRRLRDAAYGAPDIGTVTPLSNNGEYTSFPSPGLAHPAPGPVSARRIDETAARVFDGRLVDLPNGTGFCLYARHDALAAAGPMPAVYKRGYFEDVEFCLRVRRAGYRNVCAPSLFVLHHGTRSFGADKRALVVRNLAVLRARYPGFQAECAAFARADPLRGARAAISHALDAPPPGQAEPPAPPPVAEPLSAGRAAVLGVAMPAASPEGDAFIRHLSAVLRLRRRDARIVVLGRALDDLALIGRGNVFVTGPVEPGGMARLCALHGVLDLVPPFVPDDPSETPDHHVRSKAHAIVDRFVDRFPAPAAAADGAA